MNSPFWDNGYDRSPTDVSQDLESGKISLIDVREQYEWDAGRVPGARHVPLDRLAEAATSIEEEDGPVVFMCLAGVRSAMVVDAFRARGVDAFNLAGGFRAWVAAGLPTEPDDAQIAPH